MAVTTQGSRLELTWKGSNSSRDPGADFVCEYELKTPGGGNKGMEFLDRELLDQITAVEVEGKEIPLK